MEQHTIKKEASISGTGIHSGKVATIKFKPAAVNSGITFVRVDLPGRPRVKAEIKNVKSTVRGTGLGEIFTVEHVLSALFALSVTNIDIELDSPEPPILDGSSKEYCELIKSAGIVGQKGQVPMLKLKEPVSVVENGKSIIALPADRFTVSFMIEYPFVFIGSQFLKFNLDAKGYSADIAPARTYGFLNELEELKRAGLARGATKENAIAIGSEGYQTGLRFRDELVRHKILDLIGDLSLLGRDIKAHVIGIRSGHEMNIKLVRKLEEVDQHH